MDSQPGGGVPDSARNRTTMGENYLPALKRRLRKRGPRVITQTIEETFTFCNSSSTPVGKQIIIPAGIEGFSG